MCLIISKDIHSRVICSNMDMEFFSFFSFDFDWTLFLASLLAIVRTIQLSSCVFNLAHVSYFSLAVICRFVSLFIKWLHKINGIVHLHLQIKRKAKKQKKSRVEINIAEKNERKENQTHISECSIIFNSKRRQTTSGKHCVCTHFLQYPLLSLAPSTCEIYPLLVQRLDFWFRSFVRYLFISHKNLLCIFTLHVTDT